ncbi:SRPBCC family protein [Parvibaculum sp.]|uniref:SRPBCC family protein n=1 Tax=Parvibaculum sp. TaxID=2024848 RepID=UPI003299DFCF
MTSIRLDMPIAAPAESVWDAVRDVGAIHTRFVPGFVTDTRLEGNLRTVTFETGFIAQELIVDLDGEAMRLAYSVRPNELMSHHHASFQVIPEGETACRLVWLADFLPPEAEASVRGMMEQGAAVMKQALAAK